MVVENVDATGLPVTRRAAKALGQLHYFTGKPCKRGHRVRRLTSDGACVECALAKTRRWQAANKDKVLAATVRWQANNPDRVRRVQKLRYDTKRDAILAAARVYRAANSEAQASAARAYYAANAVICRQRSREFRIAHPAKVRASVAAWRIANPLAARVAQAKRRAAKAASLSHYTRDDVQTLLVKQSGKCVACLVSIKKKYHVDHVFPLSRGGTNEASNIQLLCQFCNQSKHAKDPFVWAQEHGRLL